ncbi:hypothetical protein DFP72DRAFT_1052705 [Ephemerocybe angulata]|uniref:Uncharacterized protein n=1 Tax=Ephemerocybe angulata TaxID=980116 RepID=A0A8H6HC28_9AGAR|nr:hypothetical protein DFP72DRAFT_1052705 [Tulosesus angulatus]
MRVTLAPLLTVLLSAAALFGSAAAYQDYAELEARHAPSSYLRSRDLGFSHEDLDARGGFDAEYEGLQARGGALEVPFQLSLRDFLEEAVEVYRRSGGARFDVFIDIRLGGMRLDSRSVQLSTSTTLREIYQAVALRRGLSTTRNDLPQLIALRIDGGDVVTAGLDTTLGTLGITGPGHHISGALTPEGEAAVAAGSSQGKTLPKKKQ